MPRRQVSRRQYPHPVQAHVSDQQLLWLYDQARNEDLSVSMLLRQMVEKAMEERANA